MRIAAVVLMALGMWVAGPVAAQDRQTLADIRQELTVLHVEIQQLKRELSTTGTPAVNLTGTGVLDRVSAIEAELQRLTSQTEQLQYRIDRVVADGTNRIGDLEFRLVELEGGDVSQLGDTTTLGGDDGSDVANGAASPATGGGVGAGDGAGGELAVGEEADFRAAGEALDGGDYGRAADLFGRFQQAYPGSPLAPQAHLGRGRALEGLGDTREAARAFLASFTGNANGPVAPDALFELGAALGRLGQTDQACVTLGEVGVRFPESPTVENARREMASLGCT